MNNSARSDYDLTQKDKFLFQSWDEFHCKSMTLHFNGIVLGTKTVQSHERRNMMKENEWYSIEQHLQIP